MHNQKLKDLIESYALAVVDSMDIDDLRAEMTECIIQRMGNESETDVVAEVAASNLLDNWGVK